MPRTSWNIREVIASTRLKVILSYDPSSPELNPKQVDFIYSIATASWET